MHSIGKVLVREKDKLLAVLDKLKLTGAEPIANIGNVRQDKFYEIGECAWYRLGQADIIRYGHLFTFRAPNVDLVFAAAARLGFSKEEFDLFPERTVPVYEETEASL